MMEKKQKMEIEKSIDLLEEIIWAFNSKKDLKLNDVPSNLRAIFNDKNYLNVDIKEKKSNIHHLIGILPEFLQDKDLFPSNIQIVNFAEEVLNININRKDKRSRYELIGLIVCETNEISDNKLEKLVGKLDSIMNSDEKIAKMKQISKENINNFSWNETIQLLTEYTNE